MEYTNETILGGTHATSGCAAVAVARSGGRALKQESVPGFSSSDVFLWLIINSEQWCAQETADQAARAP